MIIVVAFVLEDCDVAEDGETVGEASWNEELKMIVFGQFYSYMFAICRRVFADVDCHVKDSAFDTADKFGLSEWRF